MCSRVCSNFNKRVKPHLNELLICRMIEVLPYSVPLLRILADRGTEFCRKVDQHDYQLYILLVGK